MKLEDFKNSGLLEAYIAGALTGSQLETVEQHLRDYPELKSALSEIQRAFRAYAEIHGIPPRPELKAEIIKNITGRSITKTSNKQNDAGKGMGPFFIPFLLITALALGSIYWAWSRGNQIKQLNEDYSTLETTYNENEIICDSINAENAELKAMFTTISNPGNRIIQLTPTGNFAGTNLYLHTNEELQLNYIQALTLPSIAANQAFQLWSLKDGQNPIPLTVFNENDALIPVDFEEGTGTYAITIEQEEGAEVPNLEMLIGTIKV